MKKIGYFFGFHVSFLSYGSEIVKNYVFFAIFAVSNLRINAPEVLVLLF